MDEQRASTGRTWTERVELAGSELVARIKELIAKGNVRQVIVRKENGEVLLTISLTKGAAVGVILTLAAPQLAVLATLGALLAHFRVDIVRTD